MEKPPAEEPVTVTRLLDLVQAGNVEQLELLRTLHPDEFRAALNLQNRFGQNPRAPLHLAIELGRRDLFFQLLSWGADPGLQLYNGDTPLSIASSRNRLEELQELLKRGADPDIPGSYGVPPLWNACLMGSQALITALLEAGADVNQTCSRGTPLQAACLRAAPDILALLLGAGAKSDPTVPTAALLLPWRNISLLRRLMERGVRVTVDLQGEPLLLCHAITEMARDETSYLHVMGKDALDVFLPFLIDLQMRAIESAQRSRRALFDHMQENEQTQPRVHFLVGMKSRRDGGQGGEGEEQEDGDGDGDGDEDEEQEEEGGGENDRYYNGANSDGRDSDEDEDEEERYRELNDGEVLPEAAPRRRILRPRRRLLKPRGVRIGRRVRRGRR